MQVDAHHHVWRVSRGDYGWLGPTSPLYRDYALDDLRPLLGAIDATVLVQAAPTEAETAFMLEAAEGSGGLVRGVVGWIDMPAPDAPAAVERMARSPLIKGLRPMLQDIEATDWILQDSVQPALTAMVRTGLRLDALVQPRHLPVLRTLAERHPDLAVVIDHGAKPAIAHGQWRDWAADLARLARETRWCCKLSGMVTEAGPAWTAETLRPYADHILACFGPARVMWGSDWPVVDLAGGYGRWRDATGRLLADLSTADRDAVLGGSAAAFYGFV